MREDGPTRNKKWGILKYLSAEISYEKSETIQDQWTRVSGVLGQKLGYDILPLRFDMNLLRKLIFPDKDYNSFFVEGV